MKNVVKLFGIAVMVAAIVFTITGCPEDTEGTPEPARLKIVNQNASPITKVTVRPTYGMSYLLEKSSLNITTGNSETFDIDTENYPSMLVEVYFGIDDVATKGSLDLRERTTTVTLTADGELE